ncbi:phosphodiesterase [Alicyclobacillus contaminans]|uniref:HD-GYP domain-containing protein n=1 Tax=Alicyclobacillus contaminans TaxID=392016 RepID=UPI0003FE00F1|nr:HD-GYP domain-containing protein [Alicyclobacillus contaminans]GMA50507.1 phosphodiesterase [Alicyclobacillus contaminans]
MRWVSLHNIQPNRILARHILDQRGRILLSRGVVLTPSLVARLQRIGIHSVCIEDDWTDDLVSQDMISPETRQAILEATYLSLSELVSSQSSKVVRPVRLRQRLRPILSEVVDELRSIGGAGAHLGNVYLSDGELYHHSVNVTLFALGVGMGLGMREEQLIQLGIGALLHDVGKLRIPESILKKPGPLTDDEFLLIKTHTNLGYDILRAIPDMPSASALIALQHHERMDGSGYPFGLRGQDIHYMSRITAVADVYEALTANRVYRRAYLPHQALEMLLGGGGTQFDLDMVEAFVNTIAIYPVGMTLHLSNGYRAVVVSSGKRQTQRPLVRVIEDAEGRRVADPWEIDLAEELTIQIVDCDL